MRNQTINGITIFYPIKLHITYFNVTDLSSILIATTFIENDNEK